MEFVKKNQGPIIGVAVVVLIIVIGLLMTGSGANQGGEGENTSVAAANELGASASMFASVTSGTYIYALDGISWKFTSQGNQTQVRLQLEGLTRNSVPINVLTYRMGTYPGQCSEIDMPAGLILPELSRPLGFAQCEEFDSSRQFVVTQEGSKIVTRSRVLTQESETQFEQIQAIDVTQIVK